MKKRRITLFVLLLALVCLLTLSFGLMGCSGADGKDGLNGADGVNGRDGIDGADGQDGEDGKDGTDGQDGEDGKDGTDGEDGKDGTDGQDGKDGKDGADGKDGQDGKDGKDGADGKSAYEIWLDEGYTGTKADFLEWLRNDGSSSGSGDEAKNEWTVGTVPVTVKLTENGENYTLNVSGCGDMKNWSKAEDVPWHKYGGKISEIVIGEDVTSIGNYAFANTAVASLMIPESVKSVGKYALPEGATAYITESTEVTSEQTDGVSVCVYSESVPETYDRHWTNWGSTGNITDAPFTQDSYWHYDENDQPVVWEKIKVLFIGNSFTFYYQIPLQFDKIAEDLGYYVETYSIAVPGQTLETHAVDTSNSGVQINALLNKISDFDYVVLQEQSTLPYTDYNKFFNAVKALKKKIDETQDHAKIYLYETWGYPGTEANNTYEYISEMEQKLYEAYTNAATALDLNVSYVGQAYSYIKSETDLYLYGGDNKHPGPAGAYLSACVHVANMLGGDVRKTNLSGADLKVIASEGGTPQAMNLSDEQCEILRAAAYLTVFEGEAEKYTVRFWYDGEVKSEKTVAVGLGFNFPSCTVPEGEKFNGWILENGEKVYTADSRISYSQLSSRINDGVVDFYAQSVDTVIAVWGRWITEANFLIVLEGFKAYCAEQDINCDKVGYAYYKGDVQDKDYFLIAKFTDKVAEDGADIIFPCGNNIDTGAIQGTVKGSKELGVTLQGNSTRYVAKLNEKDMTNKFYEYITTDGAKELLNGLT